MDEVNCKDELWQHAYNCIEIWLSMRANLNTCMYEIDDTNSYHMDELMFIASMWRDENDLIETGNLDNELYEMDEIDSMM